MHSEHMLIQKLFIQNSISHNKTEQRPTYPTFPHSQPEVSGTCHSVLPVNICLQHRILAVANGTTVR
jgi:hypothetical protein